MTNPRRSDPRSTTLRRRKAAASTLLALTLLALTGTSCGPGDGGAAPPQGDSEVLIVIDGPGRLLVDGYDCDDGCSVAVDGGTQVTFEAVPAAGNVLVAWGGVCEPLARTCTRTFADGDEVRAAFAPHALRIDMTGDGIGTIEIAGPTIATTCTSDCGVAFSTSLNHAITLDTAGRTELGAWTGACGGAELPNYCVVSPTGATDVGKTWTHPPVASDDAYSAPGGAALVVGAGDGVLANDDDTSGDLLTAVVHDGPRHGTLNLAADGGFRYTPDRADLFADTFSYAVRDAFGSEDRADVTITIAATNRVPSAEPDAYELSRNDVLDIDALRGVLANDEDLDGDPLEAVLIAGVPDGQGDLELLADGSFRYDPGGFVGATGFSYRASDGKDLSDPATVTIQVTNARPTAADDPADGGRYETARNERLDVAAPGLLANDADPDGDDLTAAVDTSPSHGRVTLNGDGGFTYRPDRDYAGPDSFTYVATDGDLGSDPATVSILVTRDDSED